MSANRLISLAVLGSALLLFGAIAFQYIGGLAPCKMCIWQRWPHGLAMGLGAVTLATGMAPLALLGVLLLLVGAGIGAYHAGVEQGTFAGPDSCTSGPIGNVSADELLEQILAAPVVRCDEIAWALGGISMAGWNAILSALLAGIWFLAWKRAA